MTEKEIVKTYLSTNTFETKFPPEFLAARGKKYIVVRYCCATVGEDAYLPMDLCLHASFIMRDNYLDSFVDVVNVLDNGGKPTKYEYPENGPKTFRIWFSGLDMERLPENIQNQIDFVLKLLLIYEA